MADLVSIDSVPYPLLRVGGALQWRVESPGQNLEEILIDWTRGLGIDYVYSDGVDASGPGLLRIRPQRQTYSGTQLPAGIGTIMSCFEELSGNGTKCLYFVFFKDAATDTLSTHKIRLDTMTFVEEVNHFSGPFSAGKYGAGRPERFEKEWCVPWRDSGLTRLFRVLATIGNPPTADNWVSSAAGLFAGAFSQVQEEGTAKLARAYSDNLMARADKDPELVGSWGSGFEVGDNSVPISTIFEVEGFSVVVKPDGIYMFDKDGFSYLAELPFVRRADISKTGSVAAATVDDWDGIGSCMWHKYLVVVHETGIYLVNPLSGSRPMRIGPEALLEVAQRITNIDFGLAPRDGRPLCAKAFGDYLYVVYRGGSESTPSYFLLFGTPSEGRTRSPFIWHTIDSTGTTVISSVLFIDSDQRLWYVVGGAARYIQLTTDGHPSTRLGANRGAASLSFGINLLKEGQPISFGQLGHQAQLRNMAVFCEAVDANGSIRLGCYRDGGGLETVGADIEASGYQEREWTVGTNDLAHFVVPVVSFVTSASYDPVGGDPRIRYLVIRARTPDLITCIIDMSDEALAPLGLTKQQVERNLMRLQNAGRKTIIEPGPVQYSYSGEIYAVSRQEQVLEGKVIDALEVRHRRWITR